MTDPAKQRPVEQLDRALATARREEQAALEQAQLRDQQLAERLVQALTHETPDPS